MEQDTNKVYLVIVSKPLSFGGETLTQSEITNAEIKYQNDSHETLMRAIDLCKATVSKDRCMVVALSTGDILAYVTLDITVEWMD